MRRHIPWILIYSSMLVAELHHFFKPYADVIIKPALFSDERLYLPWFVKECSSMAIFIMIAVALYYMNTLRMNKIAARVLILWSTFDIFPYFINYKVDGYGKMYLILAIAIAWLWVDRNKLFNMIQGNEKRSNGRATN